MMKKIHAVNRFYLSVLPVICFGNTTGVSTNLTQNQLKTVFRIHFCKFSLYLFSHLSCLSLKMFPNPKSFHFHFFFHAGHLYKLRLQFNINSGLNLGHWSLPWEQGCNFSPFCSAKWTLFMQFFNAIFLHFDTFHDSSQ